MLKNKRILLAAACICLLLVLTLNAAAADGDGNATARFSTPKSGQFPEGGSWHIDTSGVLTVGGAECVNADPDSYTQWEGITGLVVEPGVKEFPHWFSRCEELASVKLPAGMTYCPTFFWCPNLKTVQLPADMTQLLPNAFEGCTGLEQITIPNGVTEIGESAFAGCASLKEIRIPKSVTGIGPRAFYGCTNLESVIFEGDAPAGIGEYAFSVGVGTVSLYFPAGNQSWQGGILQTAYGSTALWTPYTLDAQGNIVPDNAGISRVVGILESSTSDTITYTFYSDGRVVYEGSGTLRAYLGYNSLGDPTSVEVREGITRIDKLAFSSEDGTTIPVTLPASVTEIGDEAFHSSHVSAVNLEHVAVIGRRAFMASKIEAAVISDACTEIPERAFDSCTNLTSVQVGSKVQTIAEYAFAGCKNLSQLTFKEGCGKTIGAGAFVECGITELILPAGHTVFPDTEYEGYPFAFCSELRRVVLPEGLEVLPYRCFASLEKLESVVIPDSVTTVGDEVFMDCKNLKTVQLGANMPEISCGMFLRCESLTEIDIPGSVTCIDISAFDGCSSLKTAALHEGLQYISDAAFLNCGLTELTIPSTVVDMGFGNSMTNDEIDAGYGAFEGCASLGQLTILSKNISKIPWACFAGTALKYVTIPISVTLVQPQAFEGAPLQTVIFEGVAPVLSMSSFSGSSPFILYPANEAYANTYGKQYEQFLEYGLFSGSEPYTLDENGDYVAGSRVTPELAASKIEVFKQQYPEGYALGAYSVSRLNGTDLVGYGSQAFAYMLSDAIFGGAAASVDTDVTFEEVHVGDILRLSENGTAVVVTEKRADTVVVAQGDWTGAAAFALRAAAPAGTVHWGEVLSKEQVETAEYRLTRYDSKLFEDLSAVTAEKPEPLEVPENPDEETVQSLIRSLESSYPEGFPYTADIVYTTSVDMTGMMIGNTGRGCSAFGFWVGDMIFGEAPMREVTDIVFEDIMVGDLLHYDPDPSDLATHIVVVLEVYKDCLVTVEANYNKTIHWGQLFTKEQVESMYGVYTRYPEGTVPPERAEYEGENAPTPDTGVLQQINREDPFAGQEGYLLITDTGEQVPFDYTVPENGAAVLIFYAGCGNSMALFWDLDQTDWISNPYLNVLAVVSGAMRQEEILQFRNTYMANTQGSMQHFDTEYMDLQFDYHYLYSDVPTSTWPVVVVITETAGTKVVRYVGDGIIKADALYDTLCEVSAGFAVSEKGGELPSHAHQYTAESKEASCTEDGYTSYTCQCGAFYLTDYVDAYGHDMREATCETAGYCIRCGYEEEAPRGHGWLEASCTAPATCRYCGKTEGKALGHDYRDDVCTRCGVEKPAFKPGDVNGDGKINVTDAMVTLRYAVKKITANDLIVEAADVNSDGKVNVTDAMQILRFAVKKITEFKPAK